MEPQPSWRVRPAAQPRDASGREPSPWRGARSWNLALVVIVAVGAVASIALGRAEPFLAAAGLAWILGMLRVAAAVDRRRKLETLRGTRGT